MVVIGGAEVSATVDVDVGAVVVDPSAVVEVATVVETAAVVDDDEAPSDPLLEPQAAKHTSGITIVTSTRIRRMTSPHRWMRAPYAPPNRT